RADGLADLAFAQAEDGFIDVLGVGAELQQGIGSGNRTSLRDLQIELLGQVSKRSLTGLADLSADLIGDLVLFFLGLIQAELSDEGQLYLFKRLGVGGFLFEDLNDVEAILGFNEV